MSIMTWTEHQDGLSRQICKNRQCDSVKDLTNIRSEYGQSIDAIALWGNFVWYSALGGNYYFPRPRLALISCVSQEFASISNPQDDLRTNTVWNSLPPTIWNELEADISANKNHLQMDVASW